MLALHLSLMVAVCAVTSVSGHCFRGRITVTANGKRVCHVEDGEPPLEEGQVHLTGDCFNCSCADGQYQCCGVGPSAGVSMHVPDGYELKNDWDSCTSEVVPVPED